MLILNDSIKAVLILQDGRLVLLDGLLIGLYLPLIRKDFLLILENLLLIIYNGLICHFQGSPCGGVEIVGLPIRGMSPPASAHLVECRKIRQ